MLVEGFCAELGGCCWEREVDGGGKETVGVMFRKVLNATCALLSKDI